MLKSFFTTFLTIIIFTATFAYASILFPAENTAEADIILAGFRASRILSSYPDEQFPGADYWIRVGNKMSQKFENAIPASIWLVSLYNEDGTTELNFPSDGRNIDNVEFTEEDFNETYLDSFDLAGLRIFLQIEPGNANIDTLINLILNRYKHHPCVAGFGIDVEYNRKSENQNAPNYYGTKVTNLEAQRWETLVKSHNPGYKLFLKHFFPEWMPPDYRGDIIFVDDSQDFQSLDDMVDEFIVWGEAFSPNAVWFQYGYESDQVWWSNFSDPAKEIGDALLNSIPNTSGLFWVDFTITRVFPTSIKRTEYLPEGFRLLQNFPNPFNPETTIRWEMHSSGNVIMKLYDILGNEVTTLVDEFKNAGVYEIKFNGEELTSGVYFYKIKIMNGNDSYFSSKKIILLK